MCVQEWTDVNLKWNKSEYGDVEDIRIPPHKLWKPDVLMYNRWVEIKLCDQLTMKRHIFCCLSLLKLIFHYSFFFYLFKVRTKHLMGRIQRMWWLQAVVAVLIFLLEYSNQLVKLILHGSLLTIKIAKWNLEVGHIMDIR